MHKFTNRGKGPLHTRFFWVEPKDKLASKHIFPVISNDINRWTKVDNKLSRDTKRGIYE